MNSIRQLEQQEKYKNMLKRKNKEIKRLNNIIGEAIEYIEKENVERFENPTIEMALSIRKDRLLDILRGDK